MAKGLGIIGNFSGKVGNMVGYNLKDSNNKQTQGIRAYQPVVRNPKSAAQAEQRAKLAPINALYRRLKGIIDRGQEGIAYGNKSRLAFLSDAMRGFNGAWLEKGDTRVLPIVTPITKGSLPGIEINMVTSGQVEIMIGIGAAENVTTIGALTVALLAENSFLKEGDQITVLYGDKNSVSVRSIVLDSTSTTALSNITTGSGALNFTMGGNFDGQTGFGAAILSREGDNGEHLRSTATLVKDDDFEDGDYYNETGKAAAIESYMSQGANTDWPQEQL